MPPEFTTGERIRHLRERRGMSRVVLANLVGYSADWLKRIEAGQRGVSIPALVRLASRLPKGGLAAIREEHTARGHHRTVVTPFPRWVPKDVLARSRRLSVEAAVSKVGAGLLLKVSGPKFERRA